MNKVSQLLAGVSAIAVVAGTSVEGYADAPSTPITHTAVHNDAATFWVGQSNGATSCNTGAETAAQDTITITPPSGQYVYLTELLVQTWSNATGVTSVPTISFTNLSTLGGGLAPFLSAAITTTTTGYHIDLAIPFVQALKSAQPGVAVTVVPSATMGAAQILCMSAIGYFNSN